MFAQIYPQLLVSELLMYMCSRFILYSQFVSTSSTQIVLKVSIKQVSNFSELISSDQFSPQQMHCKYYNGRNMPPHNTQFRHMMLHGYLCIFLISETFSFMWNSEFHTNATLWNAIFHTMDLMFYSVERENSTLVPHKIHSLCFIMITEISQNFHTNSTF